MDDDKIRTVIDTDTTPHHHRTLSESVASLDIWDVLLPTASPYTLTSIMLCQVKSGLVYEQHSSPLAKLPVEVATGKQKASCTMLVH
jgi:hypothetical protein